jgi:hypothetical protein
MADQNLAERTIRHLQNEYLKTGMNDPVQWRLLAREFGVTDDELNAALVEFFAHDSAQVMLRPAPRLSFSTFSYNLTKGRAIALLHVTALSLRINTFNFESLYENRAFHINRDGRPRL